MHCTNERTCMEWMREGVASQCQRVTRHDEDEESTRDSISSHTSTTRTTDVYPSAYYSNMVRTDMMREVVRGYERRWCDRHRQAIGVRSDTLDPSHRRGNQHTHTDTTTGWETHASYTNACNSHSRGSIHQVHAICAGGGAFVPSLLSCVVVGALADRCGLPPLPRLVSCVSGFQQEGSG